MLGMANKGAVLRPRLRPIQVAGAPRLRPAYVLLLALRLIRFTFLGPVRRVAVAMPTPAARRAAEMRWNMRWARHLCSGVPEAWRSGATGALFPMAFLSSAGEHRGNQT